MSGAQDTLNMRILLTGIPGTGKTTIGNYLQSNKGFFHMDMEADEDLGYLKIDEMLNDPRGFIDDFINTHKDVVITWGFVPGDKHIEIINMLKKEYNLTLFWFDGDREAARKCFVERSARKGEEYLKMAMEELNTQVQNIDASNVIQRINPININTFDKNHKHRDIEEVVTEILNQS